MTRDERQGVEFVADPNDPAESDDSDDAIDTTPAPARRLRLAGLVLVAAVAVGALALTAHDSTRPAPSATGSRTAISTPTVQPTEPLAFTASRPATCPSTLHCVLDGDVPTDVAEALLTALPVPVQVTAAQTVRTVRRVLWFRQVVARTDVLTIVVDVQHRDSRPLQLQSSTRDTDGTTYVRQYSGGYLVQIEITGPRAQLLPIGRLYRLANDRRLLTIG